MMDSPKSQYSQVGLMFLTVIVLELRLVHMMQKKYAESSGILGSMEGLMLCRMEMTVIDLWAIHFLHPILHSY